MQHVSGRFNRPPRRLAKAAVRRLIDHYYWAGKRTFYSRIPQMDDQFDDLLC